MSKPLELLLVEDSEADAHFITEELRRHGYDLRCVRVQGEKDFRAQLEKRRCDVIIADYRLPQFNALRALNIVKEQQPDVPFIIVSGAIGEDVAVAAMKAGAHDYVMKGKLARLVPVVERELREAEVRRARLRAEQESRLLADLLKAVGQAVAATDSEGKIIYWNGAAERLYGWPAGEVLGKKLDDLIAPTPAQSAASIQETIKQGQFEEMIVSRRDGTLLTALLTNSAVYDGTGKVAGRIQVATDVTERKKAELELETSREQLRALAGKLQSVREEERKELSRDIHDELGQVLTGLKMELAWMRARLSERGAIPRAALLKKIALLGSQIDASADTIRKLCAELRPGILDDLGLVAAIDWQAREFSKRTGIKCQVRNQPNSTSLDSEGDTAVFRIFQEVLTNVARHAKASKVIVSLTETANQLLLEATDNGRGIRPAELRGANSLGLLGMRERAMALGGSIEFSRSRGGGTKVTLSVPLRARKADASNGANEGEFI